MAIRVGFACNDPRNGNCLGRFDRMDVDAGEIVVSHHEQTAFCIACKSKVALSLQNVSLNFVARPIAAPSPIVLAPASALPKVQG